MQILSSFTLAALLALLPLADAKKAEGDSPAKGQSQSEMNREAADNFTAADAKLNKVYQQLVSKLDEESKGKLRSAQRAWVQFRDAQAAFEADAEARGGSLAPLIHESCRTELTQQRTKELQRILKDRVR